MASAGIKPGAIVKSADAGFLDLQFTATVLQISHRRALACEAGRVMRSRLAEKFKLTHCPLSTL